MIATCRRYCLVGSLALAALAGADAWAGQDGPDAATVSYDVMRRTAVVEVYQACKESVVNIGASRQDETKPDVRHTEYASGVVLHPAGYVLTNAHLLRAGGKIMVGFDGGGEYGARLVAADERRDLAVLKIEAGRRLKPIRLGRSQGLLVGERVVTMGNPFGMGLTVAEGIVSAMGRNTKSDYTYYTDMIQTDATTNPGSSGGPLLNVSGEMVGVNTTKKLKADNIAFAIPVDRVRETLPDILAVEARYGFVLGMEVATLGPAEVTTVADGSPAAKAGVRTGDVVTRLADENVQTGFDVHLLLVGARGGEPLEVRVLRNGRFKTLTVTPEAVALRPPEVAADLKPGLQRLTYRGKWKQLPAFDPLDPVLTEPVTAFDLGSYRGQDGFGLVFRGYIEVPADGVYAFYLESDDGSRLRIGDRVVVPDDPNQVGARRRGFIPLKAGKHPIAVEYVEVAGDERLEVSWHGPGQRRQAVPPEVLFTDAP